eukprot:225876-Pelagomonas_calceolata.AAC.7
MFADCYSHLGCLLNAHSLAASHTVCDCAARLCCAGVGEGGEESGSKESHAPLPMKLGSLQVCVCVRIPSSAQGPQLRGTPSI